MADDLERLKRKRATLRTIVSKLLKKIEEDLAKHDKGELAESLELLLERKCSLKDLDENIQNLIDLDSLEADVVTSEEYQEKCSRANKRISREIEEIKPRIQNSEQITISKQSVQSSVKLPKLELGKYSGDPTKFTEFWNTFESTIDQNPNLTKIEKFAYLKTLLIGTASNVVASLDLTEKNYDECLKTLKERFGNKDIIISQFMNKLLNMEPVKSSHNIRALRKLYDEIEISVRNLETQGVTTGSFGQLLIPILLKSIPEEFVLEFNRRKKRSDDISVNDLLDFIKIEIECRETSHLLIQEKRNTVTPYSDHGKYDNRKVSRNVPTAASFSIGDNRTCIFCDKSHNKFFCDKSIKEKIYKLRKENRCYVCFRKYHLSSRCRNKIKCIKCGSFTHHVSICMQDKNETRAVFNPSARELSPKTDVNTSANENQNSQTSVSQNHVSSKGNILLQTCSVLAHSAKKSELTNLILDSGSTRSFIHINLVKKLNLKVIDEENLSVFSFGNKNAVTKNYKVTELLISDQRVINKIKIRCLITDVISRAPIVSPSKNTLKSLNELGLTTVKTISSSIGILIGLDFYYRIVNNERIRIENDLFAISTLFGWLPTGFQKGQKNEKENLYQNNVIVNLTSNVQECLQTLWNLDIFGIAENDFSIKNNENELMISFEREIEFINGRYNVPLLWKREPLELENNFTVASKRFETLKNRLIRNPEIMNQYKAVIEEQLKEGIIEECPSIESKAFYFMPHREIIKPKETTSCRIVYDASSSRNKSVKSLNEFLDIGPSLNPLILDIILNFRTFEIAFNADIAKAFLMIGILEKDRDYLKFLWLGDRDDEYKILRFKRLPFGLRCSPAILALTIKHHIKKYAITNPGSYKMLDTSMYVDDLYYGADTVSDAFRLSSDAVKIFKDAGMHLRKLQSNSKELNSLWAERGFEVNSAKESKFLGMIWIPDTDEIKLNAVFPNVSEPINFKATKRHILQTAASVYDPLGLFQPYIMKMKLLLQQLWSSGVDWDELLPPDVTDVWRCWLSELPILGTFCIPRKFFNDTERSEVSLHIFADASPKAFGAVCYFRYFSRNKFNTSFITAKGRVAPIKVMTLPRLELMAALVAAKLAKYLLNVLPNITDKLFLWSDSQITLHWIKGCARNWKPFVCNRVSEIQGITDPERWFHCSGKQNPADLISRGERACNLVNSSLWLHGPNWLCEHENTWPVASLKDIDEGEVSNEKRTQTVDVRKNPDILQCACVVEEIKNPIHITKFSNFEKLVRITALVRRFIMKLKKSSKAHGTLTAEELMDAENYLIKSQQQQFYKREIQSLKNGKSVEKNSDLFNFVPYIDENEFLRLGGRLEFSSLSLEEKHPIILPKHSWLTTLIVRRDHEKMMHAGTASTLSKIRSRYWIPKGRQLVKGIIKKCLICKKYISRPADQITAPLPSDRVNESPPYTICGLDYAGPIYLKNLNESQKSYILLITCGVTRSVHLELVTDMTTDSFLLAFRRFLARRLNCKIIYSDNAKTFKKAKKEIENLYDILSSDPVLKFLAKERIAWKNIIERAAWWGGFYERLVKSVKECIRKIVGKALLNYEEMSTLLVEVETILNLRPLTYVYNENEEPEPLTPMHFLNFGKEISFPANFFDVVKDGSKRSSLLKRRTYQALLVKQIWLKWKKLYLLDLKTAHSLKNPIPHAPLKVGDVVLIEGDNKNKFLWKLGKILKAIPGRDLNIRSYEVKTSNGVLKRTIQHLYPLELETDEH